MMSTSTPTRPRKSLADCLLLQPNPQRILQERPIRRPETLYWRSALCTSVRNALSPSECESIIEHSERVGFEPALLNIGYGRQSFIPSVRSSDRVIIDDKAFAQEIFERILDYIPQYVRGDDGKRLKVKGLNERMRILRYKKGHYFRKHSDGCYTRPEGTEESRMTVMIYLNHDFEGGHTRVFGDDDGDEYTSLETEPGLVFVFDHRLPHESPVLERGIKYAIRTDVMYSTQEEKDDDADGNDNDGT